LNHVLGSAINPQCLVTMSLCSESTSAFGGAADVTRLATGSARSRLTQSRHTRARRLYPQNRQISVSVWDRRQNRNPVVKEAKTDAELEDMILQRLLIGGVFVSVRRDPILGWRPTVVTAPKHAKNAQEMADKLAAELRKKFTLKE
jgi:hypothetical protein